ncbi:peptidoglycan editing factor PgeF [Qipengyuania sp. SS22]|uniref:peptidoglycan editing factor PgeF n=1 Tax=Qipengyuania sp. SS22 TaxID=2979461 RepID=UPI0021E56BD4|nr:peptidoglycan editing factor PgeF [Qipengyuania sp. SS22]UYH54460.1 peptidoglycan editing factor PgeF [Qipengyuania sp. SS22]
MSTYLKAASLDGIPHGFSSSRGLDVAEIIPGAPLVRIKQVHSSAVFAVTHAGEALPDGDALVTDRAGLALGIVTADCAPVLFADPVAGVIGAAHAGWRGALGGVLENTVAAMVSLGADPAGIVAAIGPTIAQASYEVDQAFRHAFAEEDARFFASGRAGHCQFDLPAYAAHRLQSAGVGQVEDLREDTYTQPVRFFSYRRATHRAQPTNGRQISIIGLPA